MLKIYKQIFTCDYCGKSYPLKNTLIHHVFNYHSHKLKRRRLLPCPYCKYYFPSDITLKKAHILQFHRAEHNSARKHLKQKNGSSFLCDYCNMKFYIKTHLVAHIRNVHIKSEKSNKIYSCEMCESYFKTRGWLGRHIMKCHVNKDKEVSDDNSKEVNDVMSNLKILNAQTDILACAIGASELDFGNLNIEMKSTIPQSDILAQAIGTTKLDFVQNVDIRKLEVLKENDATVIKCSLCKFKTKCISFLKRHMISHSTAKQYQCPHCPTKCGYLYNLKQHIVVKHNNINVDTKKKRLKRNPINNGKSLNASLPIFFENSNLSIDDSILNDMLKDIPSDMELPTSLIDIDNVLKNSGLVTPVAESPIVDNDSGNRKECFKTVKKISSNSDLNTIFKTPHGQKSITAVNALRDHDYSSKKVIDANEGNYYEINNSNIVMNTSCNINESTDAISNKLLEVPDSSDTIIEDLLDLAEISNPDPLANIEHFNADIDNEKVMNSSFGGNDLNQKTSEHTSNKVKKSTQKIVILKNELLCGNRQYVLPNTSNMINKTTQKVVILKNELIRGSRQSVQPIHHVVNDCIIYGKDNKHNFLNNINEIFPNTVFTPSIDTVNNNFTTFEVVSKGTATDLNHTNQTKLKPCQTHNLEETSYEFSNNNVTNATNAPITDTKPGPAIGSSNTLEDKNTNIDTFNDNNIYEAYQSTFELKESGTAPALEEDINMITNLTCSKDMPTKNKYVNFDLDVILSSNSNKQITVEQIKSIFDNTPESNHNPNLSPKGKDNIPLPQPVPDELIKESTSDYIYDVDDIIGAFGESEQFAETDLSVPLSNILACDPTHEDVEEATRNAIANKVMCNDGNTEELVMKLLSQDTIKTLSNAKYGVFCEICNRTFRRESNLREHKQIVHNKQKYTCDMCGKTLHSYKSLKVHIQSHSGKVQCKVCGIFIMATSMSIHMRKHNNKKPYLCALCGLRFATFSKKKCHIVKSHLRTDTPSAKSSLMEMINEINESSGDDVAVPPVITACVNAILEKQRQYKPVAKKREVKLKEYECKFCNKVFNYLFNYNRHLQTHNTEEMDKNSKPKYRRKKPRKNVALITES